MMNDRFDAQLREHLLDTADEKPADGQLDRVTDALRTAPQRHPVVARLAWRGGNAGPSRSVLYALIPAVLVVGTLGALALAGGTAPSSTPGPVAAATATLAPAETPVPAATALEPTAAPDPNCQSFDALGTYTQNAGTLPVTVTVPALPTEPWAGLRDQFRLVAAPCGSDGAPVVVATLLAHLNADACHWQGASVYSPTAFDLAAKLAKLKGVTAADPVDTEVGPFRATRIDISVPDNFDATTCDDGAITLWDGMLLDPGWTAQVYVAEVDGVTLVLTARYPTDKAADVLAEIDKIVGSLHIDM